MCKSLRRGTFFLLNNTLQKKIGESEEEHDSKISEPSAVVFMTRRVFAEIIEGKRTAQANHPVGEHVGRDEGAAGRGEEHREDIGHRGDDLFVRTDGG